MASLYPGLARMVENLAVDIPSTWPDEPDEHAEREIEQRWCGQSELHVIYRFSAGNLARQLFNQIQFTELNDPNHRRLLLVEDRPDFFYSALHQADWSVLIQSEICLLAVDYPDKNVLQRLLSRYPDIAFGSFSLYMGDPNPPEETRGRIASILLTTQTKIRDYARQLIDTNNQKRSLPFPRSICFFCAGHNIFQDACVQVFQRMGYGANRLKWKNPLYFFVRSSAWIRQLQEDSLDAILLFNATPKTFCRSSFLSGLRAQKITWFVDNPARYTARACDFEGCDVIGVFDRTYIPYLKMRSQARIVEVRTGYGIDPAKTQPKEEFQSIPIAFVGELGTSGFLPVEHGLAQYAPELLDLATSVLKNLDIREPVYISPIAETVFQSRGYPYYGPLVEYLENKAASLRRRYYLDTLADKGLTIFGGKEWSGYYAGILRDCHAGRRIDYAEELPALYASAKININIFHVQSIAAPNPRVYDVLASGGFLLSTYNEGLEDEFEIGKDLVVFHNKEELRELVDYYLAHDREREEIAQQGRKRALAKCGYGDRMQEFLHAIQKPEGDRSPYVYLRG